ncbi:MAG: thioredoxin-dependent thiol peroxidase [Gammaproteobacteria bacterium]|nr:thioredoxin-dependent thiol peroxidase [Gammaproteobacteria bacterium]
MLKVGDKAPDFQVVDEQGQAISLSGLKGKKVILYFYPKDDTPGCTREACAFRDDLSQFQNKNAIVLGVSKDSARSHQKFKDKYDLTFPLLVDEEGKICSAYGALSEKNMFGKKYWGVDRITFLIDEEGVIEKIWEKVSVSDHAKEILKMITR